MLDFDLAALYETETKKLKQQVKRNTGKFSEDFMFQLTTEERRKLIATYPRLVNLKYSYIGPMAFTEQGVAMLSSVLTSSKAIEINIEIMRAFVYYRTLLIQNKDLNRHLKALDQKLTQSFQYLLRRIDDLANTNSSRVKIKGFKSKK